MKQLVEKVKSRLRGTPVHSMYGFLRYETPVILKYRMIANLKRGNQNKVRRFLSHKLKRTTIDLPKAVAIDVVSCCNLRCPLCSVPPFITKQDDNFLPFERYREIVDGIGITTDLSLVYAGEPLLHPAFLDMVRYASRDYYTTTITNGTLLKGNMADSLIREGLDFLQISFDGFSKESFEKYRVGANFDAVKSNIAHFFQRRRDLKEELPHTTITYLVNAYNEHEVKACERFCRSLGAERFFAKAINLNVHRRLDGEKEENLTHWLPTEDQTTLYEKDDDGIAFKDRVGRCSICDTPIIRCDGEVLLCCHDIFNTVKIGNVFQSSFKELWASEAYKRTRKMARKRKLPVCGRCGK